LECGSRFAVRQQNTRGSAYAPAPLLQTLVSMQFSPQTVPTRKNRGIYMSQSFETSAISQNAPRAASRFRWLNWSGFFLAFIQSVCSTFIALHGIRLLVGIGAIVLASSAWHLAERLHVNAIRIPMMLIALFGALLNLAALQQVRRLRRRSASAWRQRQLTRAKLRSESLQLALSVLTLILLIAEEIAHFKLNGTL
jgi:hypothetical protein